MMLDAQLTFVSPQGPAVSAVGAAGAQIQLGQVIDLLGVGVGQAPPNIIGNATLFGQDTNTGIWKLDLQVNVGTAFASATSATANIAIQVAPDTGAAGGYLPGTWETAEETGPKLSAEMTANQVLRLPMPPAPPATPRPRYVRLLLQVAPAASGIFTAGTISGAFFVQGRDDLQNRQAASNYTVA